MLITIMSSVGGHTTYTNHIIWVQYLLSTSTSIMPARFALPDSHWLGHEFHRIWLGRHLQELSGVPVLLRLAAIIGYHRIELGLPRRQ